MIPRDGFIWRTNRQLMARMRTEKQIQTAMRQHGGEGFRFRRQEITDLLVKMLEVIGEALRINYVDVGPRDFNMDLITAISIAQAQIDWLNAVSLGAVILLVLELLNARMRYLAQHPEDNVTEDDVVPTAAVRLQIGVINFANILLELRGEGRWTSDQVVQSLAAVAAAVGAAASNTDAAADIGTDAGTAAGTTTVANLPDNNAGNSGFNIRDISSFMTRMEEDEEEDYMDI
jgi:hypothetical protein